MAIMEGSVLRPLKALAEGANRTWFVPGAFPDALPLMPRAHAEAGDPQALVKLARDLGPGPFAAVILFVSPLADRAALEAGLGAAFPGVTVIGCTTAGETATPKRELPL